MLSALAVTGPSGMHPLTLHALKTMAGLGVAMIGYYLGGILLLGNTPGVCLLAPARPGRSPASFTSVRTFASSDTNLMRCASPPDSVGLCCPSVR